MVARTGGSSGRYVCDLGGQYYEENVLLYGEGPGSRIEYLYYKYLYTYLPSPFTDIVVFFSYSIVGYAFPYVILTVTGYAVFFLYFYLYFIVDYVDISLFDTYN